MSGINRKRAFYLKGCGCSERLSLVRTWVNDLCIAGYIQEICIIVSILEFFYMMMRVSSVIEHHDRLFMRVA